MGLGQKAALSIAFRVPHYSLCHASCTGSFLCSTFAIVFLLSLYAYVRVCLRARASVRACHTPSIAFRHLPPKEGCRKPVLGVYQGVVGVSAVFGLPSVTECQPAVCVTIIQS